MFCKKHNKIVYFGESRLILSMTCFKFITDEEKKNNDPVARHFYTNEHNVDDKCVIGIEKV